MSLEVGDAGPVQPLWPWLPERARVETLAVLAGMIAGGVMVCEADAGDSDACEARS